MTPEKAQAWQRVLRDASMTVAGTFMLVFGAIWVREPTVLALILSGGLGALGAPTVIRGLKSSRENGHSNGDQ